MCGIKVYKWAVNRGLQQAVLAFALMQINLSVFAFSSLVIFGDSLSDTGNHPGGLLGLPPPYYQNRISNGPVAVDVLAQSLGLSAAHSGYLFSNGSGSNYAVSGANAAGNDPQDLTVQLQAFYSRSPARLDADALYVVMVGGNDVRDASVMKSSAAASTAVDAAVGSIRFALLGLMQKGARNILVVNVPDISKIPETTQRAATNPGLLARARQLSIDFNQRLELRLNSLIQTPGLHLYRFDFYSDFNDILNHSGAYGFSNTSEACFDFDHYAYHPQCQFERFVFFDSIHPTAKMHALIGQGMLRSLQRASAALPGVILLLLN